MTNRILLTCGILVAGIALAVVGEDRFWVGMDAGDPMATREIANRIEVVLNQRTECNFVDKPLDEVLQSLAVAHAIPIWLDKMALMEEGVGSNQKITFVMSAITLQTGLDLMLEPMALTHLTQDGVLMITTQAKASEKLSTRVYSVADLVNSGASPQDYDLLIDLIMEYNPCKWMVVDGEGGAIDAFPNARSLVIRQPQRSHRSIEGLLAALRKAKRLQRIPSIPIDADEPEFVNPIEPAAVESRQRRSPPVTQAWQRPRVHSAE